MPTAARQHRPHSTTARRHQPRGPESRQHKQKVYRRSRWLKAREQFLLSNPWCAHCLASGRHVPARVVDHIQEHSGPDDPLAWDPANWQPMCLSCHGRKSARFRDAGRG